MADTHVVPFIINGEERYGGGALDVTSPRSGTVVHRCAMATPKEAVEAVDAAAAAGKEWKDSLPAQRRDIFLKAAEIMEKRKEELSTYMCDEVGADPGWAGFNLNVTIDMFKDVAGRVSTLTGLAPTPADPNVSSMIWREPYGVVLAIAPWNAPYILGTRSVLFPIAAGCTVVLKGSELAPRVMHAIVSVLQQAGLPKGVVNFIATDREHAAELTDSLIAHPQVKKINFTGSTNVGRIIAKTAGSYLKPLVLELGGKAPAIIWEDADLDLAAQQCTLGSFLFSGQICMSTERIIIHKKVSEAFQVKLKQMIDNIFPVTGEAPILISGQSVEKSKRLVQDAVGKGASVIHGDINTEEVSKTRMRPFVVSKVTAGMDLYANESFGPSVSLIEVETEEEALRIANDTEYGLNSAVFTEDLRRGLRLAKGIEAGAVHINNMTVHDEQALPHGGAKASGYGRFNNSFGLDEWVRTKSVTWRN